MPGSMAQRSWPVKDKVEANTTKYLKFDNSGNVTELLGPGPCLRNRRREPQPHPDVPLNLRFRSYSG